MLTSLGVTAIRPTGSNVLTSLPFQMKVGAQGVADDYDTLGVSKYLERELKIKLHNNQELALVEAINTPQEYLKKRKAALEKIALDLAIPYQTAQNFYFDQGYPVAEAVRLADEEIQALYEIKARQMEVTLPGASVLLTSAMDKQNLQRKQFELANGDVTKDINYYKKKAKSRKVKKSTA
jgi:hypothetical protein